MGLLACEAFSPSLLPEGRPCELRAPAKSQVMEQRPDLGIYLAGVCMPVLLLCGVSLGRGLGFYETHFSYLEVVYHPYKALCS